MSLLSPHVVEHLLSCWLNPPQLLALRGTCKALFVVLSKQNVWHRLYMRLWPECTHPFAFARVADLEPSEFDEENEMRFIEGDECDWRMAACLRFGLTRANRLTAQQVMQSCHERDELAYCMFAQNMSERIVPQVHFEQVAAKWRSRLSVYGCDVGLVALKYSNKSGSSISGVCNFWLMCAIAVYLPQSAYPLVVHTQEFGSGYNDDPEVSGEMTLGWDMTRASFQECEDGVAHVVRSFGILQSQGLPFRSLSGQLSLPPAVEKRLKPNYFIAPFESDVEEDMSPVGRIRVPDPKTLFLSLQHSDSEECANFRQTFIGSKLDPHFVNEWYSNESVSLTQLFLSLCQG